MIAGEEIPSLIQGGFRRAIPNRTAADLAYMGFEISLNVAGLAVERAAQLAARSGQTAIEEIQSLPEFRNMTKAEIEEMLISRGYKRVPAHDKIGSVWTKAMPDEMTAAVRIDPAGHPGDLLRAGSQPHAHKEIVSTWAVWKSAFKGKPGNYHYLEPSLRKFDDLGNLVVGNDWWAMHIYYRHHRTDLVRQFWANW
jgi:hypothetical protein